VNRMVKISDQDERYMQMALKLARRGIGSVEPNPAVGCVIVKANQIVGKGWHKKFGGAHAEINALEDCKKLGVSPRGATMYVSLEPCCHYAKTPPCTDAIIEAGIAKVVVAAIDPSEHANGKGIEQLRRAGIEVQTGVYEQQGRLLNAPFIKYVTTGKCWTVLKWAQSIDGKMGWADMVGSRKDERRRISGEQSRKDVHKLRRRVQAILVGINTVLADNPLLTARPSKGKKLTRIVLDNKLRIPPDCKLIATAKKIPVMILTSQQTVERSPEAAEAIRSKGVELLVFADTPGQSNLYFLLDELSKRGIAQLLVEGGPKVITSFLKEQLADEICVYITPKILGREGAANIVEPMNEVAKSISLHYVDIKNFGSDVRISGLSEKALDELSISKG